MFRGHYETNNRIEIRTIEKRFNDALYGEDSDYGVRGRG